MAFRSHTKAAMSHEIKQKTSQRFWGWRWLLLAIAFPLLLISLLLSASLWLNTSDTPESADAIVVLGGDFSREVYAAELWKKGLAPEIYVSQMAPRDSYLTISKLGVTLPTDQDISAAILRKSGVPAKRIHFYGPSVSTRDEASSLKNALPPGKHFIVLTSPYHVTRARLIFRQEFTSDRFRVISTNERFPSDWWRHQKSARCVVLEILKLIHFSLGGGFTSHPSFSF
jgi:uncharacterized SAM-binding protein YcdF (DUF218 family)